MGEFCFKFICERKSGVCNACSDRARRIRVDFDFPRTHVNKIALIFVDRQNKKPVILEQGLNLIHCALLVFYVHKGQGRVDHVELFGKIMRKKIIADQFNVFVRA